MWGYVPQPVSSQAWAFPSTRVRQIVSYTEESISIVMKLVKKYDRSMIKYLRLAHSSPHFLRKCCIRHVQTILPPTQIATHSQTSTTKNIFQFIIHDNTVQENAKQQLIRSYELEKLEEARLTSFRCLSRSIPRILISAFSSFSARIMRRIFPFSSMISASLSFNFSRTTCA